MTQDVARVHLGWVSHPETGSTYANSFGSLNTREELLPGHGCCKTHLVPTGGGNLGRAWAFSGKRF